MRINLATIAAVLLLAGGGAHCRAQDDPRAELSRIDAEIAARSAAIAGGRGQVPRPMPYPKTSDSLLLFAASGEPVAPAAPDNLIAAELVSEIADLFERRRETVALLANAPAALQPGAEQARAPAVSPRSRVLGVALLAILGVLSVTAIAVRKRLARPAFAPMTDAGFRRATGGVVRRLVA